MKLKMLSPIDITPVGWPDNQEHSHREARLSGRMPQIAPRRFAVRANTVRSPKGAQRTCADRSIIQNAKLVGAVTHVILLCGASVPLGAMHFARPKTSHRGAICAHSLTSKLADSFRLIMCS